MAILSFDRSTPLPSLNFLTIQSTIRESQSSPPRWLSPEVALTSIVEKPSSSLPPSTRDTPRVLPHLGRGRGEGAAPEVEAQDGRVAVALVEAVGERRRGRLVDDALDVQP